MKFMSWSLNAPSNYYFDDYMRKIDGEWVVVDESAIDNWGDSARTFFRMYEKYHEKIHSFGLHEFGVNPDGTIYDFLTERYVNGERTGTPVLSSNGERIARWCKRSLQYLMETYPDIRYAIQLINFQSTGQTKVDEFLDDTDKWDVCIQETKKIAQLYIEEGFPIRDIEIDFERASSRDGDNIKYRDFLVRVKDEICLPLGLGLRVNMYAMTGDMTPSYYRWHDYKTLAGGVDKEGNRAIDEFQLMTYDFTYAYSAPGPSTPLWWLEEVLNHVQDSLPPEQTWIGNAGYGRRWGLDAGQAGSAVTFKQITMWQNGMYVHNHEGSDEWIWHNQSWIPFAGFNDESSGYQVTYPHLYDKFSINHANHSSGTINRTTWSGDDIVTSYFKSQEPIFTGIHGIANEVQPSGNYGVVYSSGRTIPAKYLGEDTTFMGAYRPNKALYIYDENLDACVPSPDSDGEDGSLSFSFDVDSSGNHKLIALIHFNTLQNNSIVGELNGVSFEVGGSNLPEWFPFYVDTYAWVEVGSFDFEQSNEITISPESTGYIWGFVVCDDFDQNFLGGEVSFDSYVMPYQKRGEQKADGTVEKEEAIFPEKLTVTGEILRNPPRPAIIFEDTFSSLLNNNEAGINITEIPYYQRVTDHWESGSQKVYYEKEDAYACTDANGIQRIGFSDGVWELQEDGTIRASVSAGYTNQLVLYKPLKSNVQVQADISIDGAYPKAGVRLLATEEGNGNEGYLALLDYGSNQVKLVYENEKNNQTEIASEWMSDQLINLKGSTVTIYATIHEGKAYVRVNEREYLSDISLENPPPNGCYGVYVTGGGVTLSRFNVSTVDRWEPLEKMQVTIDGETYDFGEVDRGLSYDEYGYLVYSGLNIDGLGEEKEDSGEIGGSPDFSKDFQNMPLATHPSWKKDKTIYVRMVDAGIWFKNLYVGDSEGFSVAYNSDVIGFVETANLLFEYQCKGVAMWTMGQEDPLIFEYLPND